jgi:cytochrome c-type biogenesis protein CcmH/NrfF
MYVQRAIFDELVKFAHSLLWIILVLLILIALLIVYICKLRRIEHDVRAQQSKVHSEIIDLTGLH